MCGEGRLRWVGAAEGRGGRREVLDGPAGYCARGRGMRRDTYGLVRGDVSLAGFPFAALCPPVLRGRGEAEGQWPGMDFGMGSG
ncbi:hypothetical protein B1218_34590, partial [Pseudomonas ogarae]